MSLVSLAGRASEVSGDGPSRQTDADGNPDARLITRHMERDT